MTLFRSHPDAVYRPLQWTGPRTPADARRPRYTFKATWSSTIDILDRELFNLNAKRVVLQADFRVMRAALAGQPVQVRP